MGKPIVTILATLVVAALAVACTAKTPPPEPRAEGMRGFILAQQSGPAYSVQGVVCSDLNVMRRMVETLRTKDPKPNANCLLVPFPVAIEHVVEGPVTDYEGDAMYIVQVQSDPDLYMIAWPGVNSDLPPRPHVGKISI